MSVSPIFLVVPWLLALALTPLVMRGAQTLGWLDHPDGGRKLHKQPVPTGGGVAVFVAAALGLAIALLIEPVEGASEMLWALGLGSGAMMILGLCDDVRGLSPFLRASVQTLIAAATWFAGFRIGIMELPFGFELYDHQILSFLVTVGWIVLVTNAFNFIDGVDGLATGIAVIAGLTIFVLASDASQGVPILGALCLSGALAGFLRFNLPPARIFLGDGGAYPIGYSIAVLSLASFQKSSTAMVVVVPLLAAGVPMLDTIVAMVRRFSSHVGERGVAGLSPVGALRAITSADAGHVHHLMLRSGWSVRRILFTLYGFSFLLAGLALGLRDAAPAIRWGVFAAVVVGSLLVLRLLQRNVARVEAREPVHAPTAEAVRRAG